MTDYKINIVHLYPNLLNLYGDKGNIECMKKRLSWRGIEAEVKEVCDNAQIDFNNTDIVFLGGGTEKELKIVAHRLAEQKNEFVEFAENGGTIIGICEGFELLGNSLFVGSEKISGLGILDICTEISTDNSRFTGDVILECDGISGKVVGFENHIGRTNIGRLTPLGRVIKGNGNDGISGFEGAVFKNVIGTHLHGPVFPKNPQLCDRVLYNALKHKYPDFAELLPLDDGLEILANEYIVNRG